MYKGLLVRPRPIDDETPGSLLMRAAQENGYANINQMTHVTGFDFFKQSYQAALIKLSKYKRILIALNLMMIDVAKIMGRAGLSSKSGRLLGKSSFPDAYFRDDCSTYCPACLTERPYWRRLWLFKPYTSCHKHEYRLSNTCPSCTKPLVITRGCIYKCSHCTADLRTATPEKPDAQEKASSQWIFDVIEAEKALDTSEFIAIYSAVRLFAVNSNMNRPDCFATTASHLYFTNRNAAIELMMSMMKQNSSHPRLQLLPLLSSDGYPNTFGYEILKLTDTSIAALSAKDKEIQVSAGEAIALVETSARTLRKWVEKCIKQGVEVEFPITVDLLIKMQEQFKDNRKNESQLAQTSEMLTINQAAERLCVHSEIVRSLQHKGFLKFEKRNIEGSSKAVTTEADLESFANKYVLVGTLARKLEVNATDLAAKLRSLGITPIAGPAIDGLKTSLFDQKDVKNVTKTTLLSIEKCTTNAGRKKLSYSSVTAATQDDRLISIVAAAKELNISIQKTKTLLQRGILKRAENLGNGVLLTSKSLFCLQNLLKSEEYSSLEDGCKELNTTPGMLTRNWVNTGVLDIIDCHYWKFLSKKQISEVLKIKADYVDAADGGKLLGVSRAHLINQERIGNIHCMLIGGKKLFKISDILALADRNRTSLI